MEAVGTLAGGIAHDFNNLLTVIIGYCSVLQMSMEDRDPLRVHIDPILSSSRKAADLIKSLLAFSRQQPISLKPLDLNEAIRHTEKLLKRLLTEDIELTTSLCPGEAMIMADAIQIEQILFNLATNARDAMKKGGTLIIETKLVVLDLEFIGVHGYGKPGGFVLLSVSDTGSGMDEAIKEKVFDPFFTTKEPGKGTGLGLSTVYGIVKQHDGYINMHSERGVGTTFQIYFPLVQEAAREEERSFPFTGRGSETILVAEDNEDVRRLIKSILSKYGYQVIEASDGQDAIDQLRMHKDIDLVLLDSVMPKKNGREVFDEISKTRPVVKAIFTSGYTRDIVLDKGIETKKVNFLSKPILPNELLHKVREVLDG
jgi:two-component system, cell cycle sensor histidine kinase and response regulator CckA